MGFFCLEDGNHIQVMREEALFKVAEGFYRREGKELEAIQAFKALLEAYPENLDGWTYLATMQHKITDFDGAIFAIDKAVALDPDNAWTINQKCTILSFISRFPCEGQLYFNQQTREAYEIKRYGSKTDLLLDLIAVVERLMEMEGVNERKKLGYLWKLAHNYKAVNQNQVAIDYLSLAEHSIPEAYTDERKNRELANMYREMASNYLELKEYEKAITSLNNAFDRGLDDYMRMMLADVYEEMGQYEQSKDVLQDLLTRINRKLETAPEPAFVSQKVAVLKRIDNKDGLRTVLDHFDAIPSNPYSEERKEKLKLEIEHYLKS